jgi:hypothetical protein
LEKTRNKLLKEGLFDIGNGGDLAMEEEEVFGVPIADAAAPAVEDQEGTMDGVLSNGSNSIDTAIDLHCRIVWKWEIKKVKLEHDYAMAGFALSVSSDMWEHFERDNVSNENPRDALEQVVWKLHQSLNPNTKKRLSCWRTPL